MIKNNKKTQLISIIIMLIIVFVFNKNSETNKPNSIENLFKSKTSGVFVEFDAEVVNVLEDDNNGSRHQRLILKTKNNTVLLAHNIDVAPRVPVKKNDTITVKGQYEWNDKGGVVHWTHKKDNSPYGWVMFNNKKYQ